MLDNNGFRARPCSGNSKANGGVEVRGATLGKGMFVCWICSLAKQIVMADNLCTYLFIYLFIN